MFKKDRVNKEGGGVLLYVREFLNPVEQKMEVDHEMLGVVLNNLEKKLYIYIVYRPPHQLVEKDVSLYNALGNNIRNKLCVIMGDFNCLVNWNTGTATGEGKNLLDFANEEFLTQWVDKPTRGKNMLDLVFSSEDNMITNLNVGERLGKSDQYIIRFEIESSFSKEEKSFLKLNFKRADFDKFRNEYRKFPSRTTVNLEDSWCTFITNTIST